MPLSTRSSKTHVRVAQVHSFDDMQNFLVTHAKRIAQAQRQLPVYKKDNKEIGKESEMDSVIAETVTHTHEHINVVITNCA